MEDPNKNEGPFGCKVLETIFSYLSFEDRKNVRLSCRKFRKVCGFSRFSQFEKLVIRPCCDIDKFCITLRRNMSEILHLELRSMELRRIPLNIWTHVRCKLTTLSLTQCYISTRGIVQIIDDCDRLRYLEFFRNTDSSLGVRPLINERNLNNIYVLRTAFHILNRREVKRKNLEALHINIMDRDEIFHSNFLEKYILDIFPGIKVICITHILFYRLTTVWPNGIGEYPLLTYNFSEHEGIGVWCGSIESNYHIPRLRSPEGFRRLISLRSRRYQLLFFIKDELEESIRSDVLRQRADINFCIWRNSCPFLFKFFSRFNRTGNAHVDLQNGLLQFRAEPGKMTFSRLEFLTALNSYLRSQNLGIFQLDDDDLLFFWTQLPFERNLPALSFAETENVPEMEICKLLEQFQNLRQLKLSGIPDNVLRKVFICQKELLCLHVRMSTYGCSKCHYSAYKFNENRLRYQEQADHFHILEEASIRDLTNLQCLILDYRPVSDTIIEFWKEGLEEFVLPALRHFSIFGVRQPFLWKIAKMVTSNSPNLELLEFTGGSPFHVLKYIGAVGKNLRYLRCDDEYFHQMCVLDEDSCNTLFKNHNKLQREEKSIIRTDFKRSRVMKRIEAR